MIKVSQVSKKFDDFVALSDLNMHVPKGSIYGLVGPNGAGKSTIIRHITGIYRPDSGSILIENKPVYDNPEVKSKIAYIPDDIFYFMQADTVEMKRFYEGIFPSFNGELFEKLREFFPSIDTGQCIRRLSKGMQKQVAFWLAICCNPELIILDEPVDGLDPIMRRQIWSLILSEVAEHQTTVLLSSHNLRELEDVCDHVGIMHRGQVIKERPLSELQSSVIKIQIAYEHGLPQLPDTLEILHMLNTGRVYTLIIRGEIEKTLEQLKAFNPMFIDVIPLNLEEIFIYEMGSADYETKEILS